MTRTAIMAIGMMVFICANMAILLAFGWPAMALAMLGETGMSIFMVGVEVDG